MGTCYLANADDSGRVSLDVDPIQYEDGPPARRQAVFPCDDGSVVIQDFGVSEADRSLRARVDYVSEATFAALNTMYRAVGVAYHWHDQRGHDYTICFASDGLTAERIRGHAAYRVQLHFLVLGEE